MRESPESQTDYTLLTIVYRKENTPVEAFSASDNAR
jgi:hypothetical protein